MKRSSFVFDDVSVTPDCQIGEHSHPQWELSHVICGAGTRKIGNLTEPMREGELILIPPNIPHVWYFNPDHTDAHGHIANITVLFEATLLDELSLLFPEMETSLNKVKSLSEAINVSGHAYRKVCRGLMDMREIPPSARVPKMIEILLTLASANNCVSAGSNNSLSRSERKLEEIRAFCHCNYARRISLDEIASHVGMNKSAFCTFMRRVTGQSFSEFVNDIRIRRAEEMLLHTDRNIAEIAFETGFSNVTYFNRLFRSTHHCTPKSLRSEARNLGGNCHL